ncbi:MAG TPA: TolC family protein [Longimicrobiales bacterium]|nr:TolC family protein [Longimicrobiales bacterium]
MAHIHGLRRAGAVVAIALGIGSGVSAQTPTLVTFDEAIGIALRQSSAIARSENTQTLNALAVSDARMSFLPDLRLSTSGSQDLQSSGIGGASQSMNARLSSSVTLFDGFANMANLRSAELQETAGSMDGARTRQDVVFSVISGYLTLIEAREQVRVAEDNLAAQTDREAELEILVDRGSRPIADLYQQRATAAAARSTLVEAERSRELAEVTLVQALRLDAAGEYEFEAPAIADAARDVLLDVPTLVEQALQQRADIAALAARTNAAEQEVRAAAATRLPTVSLSAGYGANYSSAAELGLTDQLDQSRGGSVSLSVSVPLFDRLTSGRAIERANVQVDNARLSLEDQRHQVALEVKRAVLDREAAVARLDAADARVAAAEQALTATEARYDAGVATLFEVTQSRTAYVDAVSAQVRARYTLVYQDQVLDYYTGSMDAGARLTN